MITARDVHAATLLAGGEVLVAGGIAGNQDSARAEIYDPATSTWSAVPSMANPRAYLSATLLGSGKVLVAGGGGLASTEIYDPVASAWSPGPSMAIARDGCPATLLPSGQVLVEGGHYYALAEVYNPVTSTWSAAPSMAAERDSHAATLLADGRVLVAGGRNNPSFLSEAELFTPAAADGVACSGASGCASGFCVDGVCCNTACAGGATDCQACSVAAGAAADGTCGPTTGNACDDGHACTQGDTCQGGACAAGALVCTPTCVTVQRGAGGGAVADALINSGGGADGSQDTNYGGSVSLTASVVSSTERYALARFDLSPVPSGALVTSATATLYVLLNGGAPVRAHQVTAPWSESTVTWASFAGAFSASVEATFPAANAGTSVTADLTALAQSWASGALPNDGILLERDAGSTVFASSEYTVVPGDRPQLAVCYVP